MTLGLDEPDPVRSAEATSGRLVEVAVDAAGGQARTYTYAVPDRPGRSRARRGRPGRVRPPPGARDRRGRDLTGAPAVPARPIVARVRARRPAAAGAQPRARQLDRHALPGAAGPGPPGDAAAGTPRATGADGGAGAPARTAAAATATDAPPDAAAGRPARAARAGPARRFGTWPGPMGGPGCCAASVRWRRMGVVTLEWTLVGSGAGPRYERWIRLTAEGARDRRWRSARARAGVHSGPVRSMRSGSWPRARPARSSRPSWPGVTGSRRWPGSSGAGLLEAEVRERPRRPLAARPVGRRGGRPPSSDLLPAQAEAVGRIRRRDRGSSTPGRSCSTA